MNEIQIKKIDSLIRTIPDFPEEGILFRDITTVLKDKEGLKEIIDIFVERYKDKGIDYVLGADARGFIFGAAIAYNIGAGFVPARKPGKLPSDTVKAEYSLEYGKNSIEVHKDAFFKGARVLIVDDLLATGGTAGAMVKIVETLEAEVYELAFLIELEGLKGREVLAPKNVFSILKY